MAQIDGTASGHDPASGQFTHGNNEYHAKRQRIAALVDQLSADYDMRSGVTKALLNVAAGHIDTAARARSHELRSRATRMAAKTLALIPKAPEPSIFDYLHEGADDDAT
jgi:hypothetical protein